MKDLSVIKKIGALLGVSSLSILFVIGALYWITGNQQNSLEKLMDQSTESHEKTFQIVSSLSESQENLFRLAREKDPDSIETIYTRYLKLDSLADSLSKTLGSPTIEAAVKNLQSIGKSASDQMLTGEIAVAQQRLVEEYNPAYSDLFRSLAEFNNGQERLIKTNRDANDERIHRLQNTLTVLSLILFGIVILFGSIMLKSIRSSIAEITRALLDLVSGESDLRKRLEVSGKDEFGTIANYFNQFLDQQTSLIRSVSESSNTVYSTAPVLSTNAKVIAETARDVSSKAQSVASAVEESSVSIQSIASNAIDMERMISTVAAAMEEMGASLQNTETSCREEVQAAEKGKKIAQQTKETIQQLDSSAEEINRIVDTINDIAEQTNLLALNATIEAATAGEAGKGFAVVANEVKELAKQTALATESISNLSQSVRKATGESVNALERIDQVIASIGTSSLSVLKSISEQTLTIREVASSGSKASQAAQTIVRNVNDSAIGLQEISKNTAGLESASQKTLQGVETTETSLEQLSSTAGNLQSVVSRFKL